MTDADIKCTRNLRSVASGCALEFVMMTTPERVLKVEVEQREHRS